MNVGSTTITPASAAAPATAPTWTGTVMELGGSGQFSTLLVRSTGETVGRQGGYATEADALHGATYATSGSKREGAGVFESDGRFFVQTLSHWGKYDDQLGESTGPFHFEGFDDPFNGDLYGSEIHPDLRAIVDGTTVVDVERYITE